MWRINCRFELDQALRLTSKALDNQLLQPEHKSEIHRLQALIYSQTGKIEEANNEVCEALKVL